MRKDKDTERVFKSFRNKLRDRRLHKKLTQKDLAKRSGVSQTSISMYERGVINPSVGSFLRLARVLGISVNILR